MESVKCQRNWVGSYSYDDRDVGYNTNINHIKEKRNIKSLQGGGGGGRLLLTHVSMVLSDEYKGRPGVDHRMNDQ